MIPKAVHICHIIVKALSQSQPLLILKAKLLKLSNCTYPLMVFGADSAAYTGVVLLFAPTAKPRAKRAINRLIQLVGHVRIQQNAMLKLKLTC